LLGEFKHTWTLWECSDGVKRWNCDVCNKFDPYRDSDANDHPSEKEYEEARKFSGTKVCKR